MKIWVITQYYNEYNQYGGYFVSAHTSEKSAIESVPHVGRINYEDSWYEVESTELKE